MTAARLTAAKRNLYVAVAEERGLPYDTVEGVIESAIRMTCDDVRQYGSCVLGGSEDGSTRLAMKIESYGDEVIAASGTWTLREEDPTDEDPWLTAGNLRCEGSPERRMADRPVA